MRTFISYAHADEANANEFVDFLRLHYVSFFLAHRSMKGGYFQEQIQSEIRASRKFIVLISPAAMQSQWVRDEVAWAMECEHLRGNILPVLIEPTPNWQTLHEHIGRLQLFDLTTQRDRTLTKMIEEEYNRPRHRHNYYQVGDIQIQVLIFAGGNGQTRYRDGDIRCDGPTEDRRFLLPPDIAIDADKRIAEVKAACDAKGALFVNNRQVRLWDYSFGGARDSGGLTDKPMRLKLGWTEYYHTRLTNQSRDHVLPCGNSIALKYGRDLEDFSESGLSNPIAVNMTVVTSDGMIYLATRGKKEAWNPGELQPAVSGVGQPEDLNEAGIYDPYRTAIREAKEECVGSCPVTRDQVTFFGLARMMGTQFPFLFGEIRLPITSRQLQGYPPLNPFEGRPMAITFTVESVCDFVREHHLDHYDGRRSGVIGTTLFSLLQSLHYEYPDRWHEVGDRLSVLEDVDRTVEIVPLIEDQLRDPINPKIKPSRPRFFVSYARARPQEADVVELALRRRNFVVLRDERDFGAGRSIPNEIEEFIRRADVFVMLWCKEYACSPWCFDELEVALKRHSAGALTLWIICVDDTRIVPPLARDLINYPARSREELERHILALLEQLERE